MTYFYLVIEVPTIREGKIVYLAAPWVSHEKSPTQSTQFQFSWLIAYIPGMHFKPWYFSLLYTFTILSWNVCATSSTSTAIRMLYLLWSAWETKSRILYRILKDLAFLFPWRSSIKENIILCTWTFWQLVLQPARELFDSMCYPHLVTLRIRAFDVMSKIGFLLLVFLYTGCIKIAQSENRL